MMIRAIALGFTLISSAQVVRAREKVDVIVMENGDRMTGEIKGLSGGVLTFSLDYVDGNLSIQWSKVARIESPQLFLIRTQDGSVYTSALGTPELPGAQPRIRIAEEGRTEKVLQRSDVVQLDETSESFVQRLSGEVTLGVVYSKGNNATQYTLGAGAEYRRERWGLEGVFNSNLSSSTGSSTATRNQLTITASHLMTRKNYFYGGFGDFLQSSTQGINLQTTVGGGIGRYFKNTNRVRVSVLGGLAWQSADYQATLVPIARQQIYGGVIVSDLRMFLFKKTNLTATAMLAPAFSDPGRVHFSTNVAYYLKLFGKVDWNLSFYGNWDTRPPDNLASSDYGYSSGIKYTFGYK
jgi:hypothetical protein